MNELPDWQREVVDRVAAGMDWRRRFGNPAHLLGFPVFEQDGARMHAEMEIGELHLNPNGVAHGMITFGLLDNAMGNCVSRSRDPQLNTSTIEIKVQFIRPVRIGSRVRIEAEPVRIGNRLAFATGRITDDEGVAVIATGTYAVQDDRNDRR